MSCRPPAVLVAGPSANSVLGGEGPIKVSEMGETQLDCPSVELKGVFEVFGS